MDCDLEAVVRTGNDKELSEALRLLPKNILCGFNFSTYSNSSDTRVKKIKDIKRGTVYQITIENPHFSEDIFEIPIIRVPEGASKIYSIPPMAVLDSENPSAAPTLL